MISFYHLDAVVVGAGVIGLACAKHFVELGFSTVVVESDSTFGASISSRSSEGHSRWHLLRAKLTESPSMCSWQEFTL
jgi:flavin-dependent dehydrogenase